MERKEVKQVVEHTIAMLKYLHFMGKGDIPQGPIYDIVDRYMVDPFTEDHR